ncbi:hypothetical protein [Micromonospora sp. CNB394]|uniref:hypothetical protein n=1 Tax=Micromonospora sp. CNB394 TaxID=1169151 RepID=UPI000375B013|nr:hypothetical protein [Micromonospora sp. CNB394]
MSVIRGLLRGQGGPAGGVVQHTVGNAMVLHAEETISAEAQSLALTVVEDADNDVVVLDLGHSLPIGSWESMALVLPRRRRGIRLMACGSYGDTAAMAGQWLSERLNRTVIAPDGELIRGAGGGLFVHSTPNSGWIRFRPGKPPTWDAKRYPAPMWDKAATERRASSSTGEIEPLPGGVWIHDVRDPETVAEHRQRLVTDVPCQPEVMTVLLGCPGTAPLSLDDVVRFWRGLDPQSRDRARFVQYGDVRLPEGEAFGQALADLLATGVICYTGVPIGAPYKYEIRAVRADGVLGWQPFALELGYVPRSRDTVKGRRPAVLRHRAPLPHVEEIESRTYWYAPDAVIEVVQAGLWVRSAQVPPNADQIRDLRLDPEGSRLVFDDSVADRTGRMRELAEDLAARVESSTGPEHTLLSTSELVRQRPAGRAEAVLVATAPPIVIRAPREAPQPAVTAVPAPMAEAVVHPAVAVRPVPAPVADRVPPVAAPIAPPVPVAEPATVAVPPVPPAAVPVRAEPSSHPEPAGPPPVPIGPVAVPEPAVTPVTARSVAGTEPVAAPPAPVAPPGMAAAELVVPPAAAPDRPAGAAPPPAVTAAPPRPAPGPVDLGVRHQPVPAASASALLPKRRQLDDERAWLRRALSRDFDTMASSVARIMSEHPGLQGSGGVSADDILADSVAVRLYLSGRGAAVDVGLRSGTIGPHVPFARCVVAGLSRLPSYRGAAIYRTSPLAAEWAYYRQRRPVTDWSFVTALTAPCSGQPGDTDVLIWSMTARRTALLEPAGDDRVEDRVLFLPGTHFKILELREPAGDQRGAILMREIGATEIGPDGRVDPGRASFDELAATSLRRSLNRWAEAEPARRVGSAARERFGVLPGLDRRPADEEVSGG